MNDFFKNIKLQENNEVEFKSAKGGLPKSFFETYSAFSNSKGGTIYLGISEYENGYFFSSGLNDKDIDNLKKSLFNLMNNKEKVSVNLLSDDFLEVLEYENSKILKIKIIEAPRELKPVYINNNILVGTYRRNYDGDYRCTPSEIKSMLRDSAERSLDLEILEDLKIDSLSTESINSYKKRLMLLHPEHIFLKKDDISFLEYLGAIRLSKDNEYHPTKAGLLMFGYSHKIVYEYPEYYLDYEELYSDDPLVRWTDRVTSDSTFYSGNLYDFYNIIVNKLSYDIKTPFVLNGIERIDETDMHKALREALCNALSNADFYIPLGLVIKKYREKIVFMNPGTIRIGRERAYKGGESDARNKTILKMFNLIGIGERAGSGIPSILNASKRNGYKMPELTESYMPDRTTLTIYLKADEKINNSEINNKISETNKRKEKENQILSYLSNNKDSKVNDISNKLNISVSTVKQILYKLKEEGLVSSKGTIKDKVYNLNLKEI